MKLVLATIASAMSTKVGMDFKTTKGIISMWQCVIFLLLIGYVHSNIFKSHCMALLDKNETDGSFQKLLFRKYDQESV